MPPKLRSKMYVSWNAEPSYLTWPPYLRILCIWNCQRHSQTASNICFVRILQVCDRMLSLKDQCLHPTTKKPYIRSAVGGKENSPEKMSVCKLSWSLALEYDSLPSSVPISSHPTSWVVSYLNWRNNSTPLRCREGSRILLWKSLTTRRIGSIIWKKIPCISHLCTP